MKPIALIAGDAMALAVVTLLGFSSHGEFSAAYVPRMAAVFVPLCIGWYLLAPALGLFDEMHGTRPGELWRPAFGMLFAGPLAALLRGVALGSPVVPSFAIVLTLVGALALTLWRAIWLLIARRR